MHRATLVTVLALAALACSSKSTERKPAEGTAMAGDSDKKAPTEAKPADEAKPEGAPSPKPSDANWAKAIEVANAGLEEAYATWAKQAAAGVPAKKPDAWITKRDGAASAGDSSIGWSISWGDNPPSGYAYDVTVYVEPTGEVKLTSAKASFSNI